MGNNSSKERLPNTGVVLRNRTRPMGKVSRSNPVLEAAKACSVTCRTKSSVSSLACFSRARHRPRVAKTITAPNRIHRSLALKTSLRSRARMPLVGLRSLSGNSNRGKMGMTKRRCFTDARASMAFARRRASVASSIWRTRSRVLLCPKRDKT